MEGGTGLLKAHTIPQTALDKRTQDIIDLCNHIIPYFHNTKFRRYIEDYKKYLGYKGDRQLLIKDWQTNIFIPLVATYADTMYNSLYDSKMKFHINNGIEGMETILNLAFDKDNNGRRNLLDAAREAIITGKGFIKPYLDMEERNIIIKGKEYGKTKKSPQITYVSIFNVFYDYNGTIEDSPFIMERFILSEASIKKRYSSYIKSKEGEDALKRVLALPQCRFSDYDYNRVKNILSYEEDIVMNKRNTYLGPTNSIWDRQRLEGMYTGLGDTTNVETTNNIFAVDFKKNKKYEVIEYRDENSLTVIIDGKKFFYTQQTNFLGRVYDISFGRIPGTSDSTGIASNIGDIQATINTLQNIFLDGLKMDAAPMYEQVGGLNQMLGNKNTIEYTPYGVISTNTAGALKKIEMGTGGFEPINANQALEGIAEKRVGVNEYITGGQGKVERVSGGVDLIYNQYKSRLMPITDSINQVMASVAKEFLIMYMQYFTSDELKALGLKGDYTIEQIINEEGVSFTLTALALLEKEELFAHILDNMNAFVGFINGPTGQNINTKEFVRAILTKEVDMDKILDTTEEDAKMKQMNQAQYQGGGQQQYQGGGLSAMAQNARY